MRQELLDETALALAGHRLADDADRPPEGEVGDLAADLGDGTLTFSASISAVARTRIRSSSARVAAISASRVSWATFWARARMSFASRRASVRAATRSCSALSRSRRAARRPSGPARCAPAVGEHPRDGLERERAT